MKALLCIGVVLLGIIAYRIPDEEQLGKVILAAQRGYTVRGLEIHQDAEHAQFEKEQAQEKATQAGDLAASVAQQQADFDALPKWDAVARPINREPPIGLRPTAQIPAAPVVRNYGAEANARKADEAAAIRQKYGGAAR